MLILSCLALLAVGVSSGRPEPATPPKPDPALVGRWTGDIMHAHGKWVSAADLTFEFMADGKMRMVDAGTGTTRESEYATDAAKNPRELDWVKAKGQAAVRAVYVTTVDSELVVCYDDEPGAKRPTNRP